MREITVFATEGIFTLGISDIGSLVVVGRKEEKKKNNFQAHWLQTGLK